MQTDRFVRALNRKLRYFQRLDRTVSFLQLGGVISFFSYLFFVWWSAQELTVLIYLSVYLLLLTLGRWVVMVRLNRLHLQRSRVNERKRW